MTDKTLTALKLAEEALNEPEDAWLNQTGLPKKAQALAAIRTCLEQVSEVSQETEAEALAEQEKQELGALYCGFCNSLPCSCPPIPMPTANAAPVSAPKQEPVAFALSHSLGLEFSSNYPMCKSKERAEELARQHMGQVVVTPLYAAPVSAKAIQHCPCCGSDYFAGSSMIDLDKAIKNDPLYQQGRAEALEEAAKVCEEHGPKEGSMRLISDGFAAAIRARGEK